MSAGLLPPTIRHMGRDLPLPSGEQLAFLARHELLTSYLRRRLLEGLANHAPDAADPTEEDLHQLQERLGLGSDRELESWRQHLRLDLETLQDLALFPGRVWSATEAIWGENIPALFLERQKELDQVVVSLVRFRDPDLAQELYFQLKEGELTFAELVEHHATGPDQLRRGLLGPLPMQRLHPLLAKVVLRYPQKSLVPPIDIDGVIHLIRVEEVIKAELNETMRQQLLRELRNHWLLQQLTVLQRRLLHDSAHTSGSQPR